MEKIKAIADSLDSDTLNDFSGNMEEYAGKVSTYNTQMQEYVAGVEQLGEKITALREQIAKTTDTESTEKIKSDDATGIVSGCPWNSPIPNQLPVPIANKDCAT